MGCAQGPRLVRSARTRRFARCGLHAQPRRIVAAGAAGVAFGGPRRAGGRRAAEFSCDLAISRAW